MIISTIVLELLITSKFIIPKENLNELSKCLLASQLKPTSLFNLHSNMPEDLLSLSIISFKIMIWIMTWINDRFICTYIYIIYINIHFFKLNKPQLFYVFLFYLTLLLFFRQWIKDWRLFIKINVKYDVFKTEFILLLLLLWYSLDYNLIYDL